ncbi:MAG: hypothetical protein JW795_21645 [Chitinivibrionales bacterium]|nr:hypothetical protein [Chitinivibrionales bacterium]
MSSGTPANRRPIGNFFLKKSLQYRIIFIILGVVLLTSSVTIAILAYAYHAQSKNGTFYYMSNDIMQDLQLRTVVGIVLPPMIAAQVVSFLIAIGIGMFSSRKVAVPIYKLERWASQIRVGKFKTQLAFRENKIMRELTIECNGLASMLCRLFSDIDRSLEAISKDPLPRSSTVDRELHSLQTVLKEIDYRQE